MLPIGCDTCDDQEDGSPKLDRSKERSEKGSPKEVTFQLRLKEQEWAGQAKPRERRKAVSGTGVGGTRVPLGELRDSWGQLEVREQGTEL